MPPTVDQQKKKKSETPKPATGLRRLLSLTPRRVETAFLPDTSLVLEERRQQLRRHDWKSLPPSGRKRVSFSPRSDTDTSDIGSEIYDTVSKSPDSSKDGSEIYGIVKGRQLLPIRKGNSTRIEDAPTRWYWGAGGGGGWVQVSSQSADCRSTGMLIRWKNKEKNSKSASSSSTPGKKKRKFGREEEEWNADGKQRPNSTTPDQSGRGSGGGGSGEEEGSSGRGGSRRLRDDLRRHTLSSSEHRYAQLRTMDLETGTKSSRRKSPQPRGYPPPNMLLDDDPGIMSEVETSSTGFRRGNRQRSSLPVVRTASKTLERPLGLVFLQYRSETKRALLPNEITSIDTVKALFVRSFPKQLTMEYMDSPHVKIYIHDSSKDMFYELEDLRSHLRDIRDRSVLRLFESGDVVGAGPIPTWDQDQSYFSEPEFDSEFQHQHIHKTKGSKSQVGGGPPYYMTHSFPPGGGTLPRTGGPLLRPYPPPNKPPTQVDGYMSSPERGPRGYTAGPGYPGYDDPYYAPYSPRPGTITPVIDEEASDTEGLEESYGGAGRGFKMAPRPPVAAVFPQQQIDQTRGMVGSDMNSRMYHRFDCIPESTMHKLRVEHMERQLASLTGLVQKALTQAAVPPGAAVPQAPPPLYHRSASVSDDFDKHSSSSSASLPDDTYLRSDTKPPKLGRDKSVSFEKSVSFSDEPPDMNSPKQHSPQHPADSKPTKPAIKSSTLPRMSSQDRDRHKPTPPPKPVSLSPGQYESRNVYRDLQLTAEMYNHLRGLQKKAKDLRQEVRALRRMSQAQAHSVRETIRDTFLKIRAVLMSAGGEGLWCPNGDESRLRVNREGDLYRQQMLRLESDLTELEGTVEELRGNVINRKTRVNMSDVESMALILSKSSKTVAELKLRFPSLQDAIKSVIAQEMDKVVAEEKFLKEEPERLESALRRCKKLTGTLVTLKRLASVQEQRLPESRLSPSLDETPPVTPTSGKGVPGEEAEQLDGEGGSGGGSQRSENPLDALLDELQSFRGVRRLHSVPPPPPPRTSSKSPSESSSAESVASQPAVSRAEILEAKHRELLRKQRALQEQYTRLQSLQAPPDLLQLKKTGSESNLLGKMGLTLAPTGSLSHLAPTTTSSTTTTTTTTTSKIYETDIL